MGSEMCIRDRINEEFVKGFENTFYQKGQIDKRGGRFITFKGLPCYQAEGILPDGRTTATWIFAAHGSIFQLSLIGGKKQIELDPQFESFMEGFEFTTPPEQRPNDIPPGKDQPPAATTDPRPPKTAYDAALSISKWMGLIAVVCIFSAILLALILWLIRKPKAKRG